jgi:hypothetical protein
MLHKKRHFGDSSLPVVAQNDIFDEPIDRVSGIFLFRFPSLRKVLMHHALFYNVFEVLSRRIDENKAI